MSLDVIDPISYERTYWLGPDGDAAATASQLLLAAMEERGRVGNIERTDKGEDVVVEAAPEPEGKVLDLMAALEASLAAGKKPRKKAAAEKKAARNRAS